MNMTEISIVSKNDFNTRFVLNFVYFLQDIKSHVYVITLERCVSASSPIALLNENIKENDVIRISVHNNDIEKAESDLKRIINYLMGDNNV